MSVMPAISIFALTALLGALCYGALAARLLESDDPTLRLFADRGIVPRDHWAIVPERAPDLTGDPDD